MPKKGTWLSYAIARQHMKEVQRYTGPLSRSKFRQWHAVHKPSMIPRYPNRVYREWISWNDFLQNNNTPFFREKPDYLPYWDAVRVAQQLAVEHNITTIEQWQDWYNFADKKPVGVPKYPHHTYKEFYENGGYKTWLGKNLEGRLAVAKHTTHIMALCTYKIGAGNIIEIIFAKEGIEHLKEILSSRSDINRVLSLYVYEEHLANDVHNIFNTHARKQDDKGLVWLVPNVSQLMFELSNILLIFRDEK